MTSGIAKQPLGALRKLLEHQVTSKVTGTTAQVYTEEQPSETWIHWDLEDWLLEIQPQLHLSEEKMGRQGKNTLNTTKSKETQIKMSGPTTAKFE